ncbi:MAG: hypothetical protein ISR65_15680 [Bacteriovoracaceae bacterium]|nr:hypothetical protein [Bacteriovoracaceae bacterium]
MKNVVLWTSSLTVLIGLLSCSQGVVQRNHKGLAVSDAKALFNNGIKKKVALLNLFNEAPYGGEDLAIVATEELNHEINGTGEFIVDPLGKKSFGNSKEIYAGGGVKLIQLSRQARIMGINFVIFGRIVEARVREKTDEIGLVRTTKSFSEAKVEIRIFNINSNKEIFSETMHGATDDTTYRLFNVDRESKLVFRRNLLRYAVKVAIRRAIPKVIKISSRLDWIGRVAKIIGTKIYLNAGRRSGMNVGDILKIMTEGTEVYDPETGALLGMSKGEIKGTVEVIDYFGENGSIAILHSGGSVQEGDLVQLY